MDAMELLEHIRESEDPMEQYKLFQQAGEEGLAVSPLREEWLWWRARYAFVDKKQTRTKDRFVWLIMMLSSWSQQGNWRRTKELDGYFREALATQDMERAMAAEDRLYESLYRACSLYADTLAQGRSILGIVRLDDKGKSGTNTRVSKEVAKNLLLPIGVCCRAMPRADLLARAMFQAVCDRYPGVRAHLMEHIDTQPDQEGRSYLLGLIGGQDDARYGGK